MADTLQVLGYTLHKRGDTWRGQSGEVQITVWRRTYTHASSPPRWEAVVQVGPVRDGSSGTDAEDAARKAMRCVARLALDTHRRAIALCL